MKTWKKISCYFAFLEILAIFTKSVYSQIVKKISFLFNDQLL